MSFPNISHRVFRNTCAKGQILGPCMSPTWFVRTDGDAEYYNLIEIASSDALSPPGDTALTSIDNVLFLLRNRFVWLLDRQFASILATRKLEFNNRRMGSEDMWVSGPLDG